MYGLPLVDECIKKNNFSGLEALLSLGAHISVATIIRVITYIKNPETRYKFCELLVNYYGDKKNIKAYVGEGNQCYLTEIPTLCDRYPVYNKTFWKSNELHRIISSMENICATNDLDLVKLFLKTVDNINPIFMFAVESKNIEMVKLFIKAGADVNFQDLEFGSDNNGTVFRTPLKIAIDNNDLKMVKFLHENGANLDFVDKSERMQELIGNLGNSQKEKDTHQYEYMCDRKSYITWTTTPLEYAITLGTASCLSKDNYASVKTDDKLQKQFKDRMNIVKYLYENGATFSEGQMNYTDLICFAIKSDDFASTEYFLEEAFKKGSQLDFGKIISYIHNPGIIETSKNNFTSYKNFENGAIPWFKLLEQYSQKMDKENYNRNLKLMLEKIFDKLTVNDYQYERYKDIIVEFSKALPKHILKEIPAVFGVDFNRLEEVINLGYDINCIKDGKNIIMEYIQNRYINVYSMKTLLSLGADANYLDPQTGDSPLSYLINKLPEYDFGKFLDNFNRKTKRLNYPVEEYEKVAKSLVISIIENSNEDIITSKNVCESVYRKIKPGYPQIIYDEILKALSKKGFKVNDSYVSDSIMFLDREYSSEFITNQWLYLWNLYTNFDNKAVGLNYKFPQIEDAKNFEYGTEESNNIYTLICEHLKRCFATSIKDIEDSNEIIEEQYYCNQMNHKYEALTALNLAQDKLLDEITRYVGILDYRQIMSLIDEFSIIDGNAIIRSELLIKAIDEKDVNLCKELIERGATIACYDENGHDITSERYDSRQIKMFETINTEYNHDKEYEDLLKEIGCNDKILLKKRKK